jgi:chemotaxis-related protein WspD
LVKFIHCRNCPVYSAAGLQLLDRPLPADYRRECAEHYAQEKKTAQPARLSVVIFRLASEWLALPTTAFQEVASPCELPRPVALRAVGRSEPEARGQATDVISRGERRAMHSIPHRRRGLALGLVNVRGELLVCASVARLVGLENANEEWRMKNEGTRPASSFFIPHSAFTFHRLLVTSWNGLRVAFPVDEVFGIQRFPKAELKDPPWRANEKWRMKNEGTGPASSFFIPHSSFIFGVFAWRDRTVGLLDADTFFSTLNRSLAL